MGINDDFRKKMNTPQVNREMAVMPRSIHEEWLKESLDADEDNLTTYEIDFLEDIDTQFISFPMRTLTRKQEEMLERIIEKVRR
jgi:hypothetical protein